MSDPVGGDLITPSDVSGENYNLILRGLIRGNDLHKFHAQ